MVRLLARKRTCGHRRGGGRTAASDAWRGGGGRRVDGGASSMGQAARPRPRQAEVHGEHGIDRVAAREIESVYTGYRCNPK